MDDQKRETILAQGQDYCDEAIAYAQKGVHSRAIEYFELAERNFIQTEEKNWITFVKHEKIHSLRQLGKLEEALILCEEVAECYLAIKKYSGLSLLMIHKASLYTDQEKWESSLSCLRIAEGIVKKDGGAAESLGYIYSTMATSYFECDNFLEGIEFLRKAMSLYTSENNVYELAWCYHQLGYSHQQIYQVKIAEEFYEKAYLKYQTLSDHSAMIPVLEDLKGLYIESEQLGKAKKLEAVLPKGA